MVNIGYALRLLTMQYNVKKWFDSLLDGQGTLLILGGGLDPLGAWTKLECGENIRVVEIDCPENADTKRR